ncbi:MAG: DUF3783 domain-containing protein [Clostridia bacterium]|nr:DUF3783 domain-containing protein [Clostridia bacterium]
MVKTVLIYAFRGEEEEKLKKLASGKGVRLIDVPRDRYGEKIAELLAGRPSPDRAGGGEDFPERMMVFAGFEEEEFDLFLKSLREEKIGSGALKAILTPVNAGWTSRELFRELGKEREAFFRMRGAGKPGV